jgi:hypothetical protein
MLAYFVAIWFILRPFGKIYTVAIWYLYIVPIWHILWLFGIFFPVLVCCTKKNLATLATVTIIEAMSSAEKAHMCIHVHFLPLSRNRRQPIFDSSRFLCWPIGKKLTPSKGFLWSGWMSQNGFLDSCTDSFIDCLGRDDLEPILRPLHLQRQRWSIFQSTRKYFFVFKTH